MAIDKHSSGRVFADLWQAVWCHRRRTLAAFGLLVLAKIAGVAVPLLLKAIVDRFSSPSTLGSPSTTDAQATILVLPVFLLLAYAVVRFGSTLFTELRDLVFARVAQRTISAYAERTFAHLLSLGPRFHGARNTGALIRDVERGTSGIGFLLGAGLFTVLPTLIELLVVLAIMGAGYSVWFTLIIVVTFFVYAGFTSVMTGKRALRQRQVNELDSRANARLVDTLLNYDAVKSYARERFERESYGAVLDGWVERSVENQQALSRLHVGQSAIIAAGVATVMLLAGQETLRGAMTVGDLVLVNAFVIQICLPLNALGFVFRQARDAMVNIERLLDLLDQKPELGDARDSRPLELGDGGGTVEFENVSFAYEESRQILRDVSLSIGAGKSLAVVGGSGSGKSTLARLLMRLYDPNEGRILIDGQDLRQLTLESLRKAIGVVPQDTMLFNDSIAYNIAYGRTGAGMAEVVEAAKAAQVHEFVMSLPEQYETVVGERGLKLSGGEKQRVAIARAFVKNPPIMILDEATSALDTRAERAIQGELDRIAAGRTTLIIAHRLSTIVNADEIVVMDQGRIVERGRHEALLEREGPYAQLWNLQLQQRQLERMERQMARQPVDLALLVADTIEQLRSPIATRRIRLYTELDMENVGITGDPVTLGQVLRELCAAALQATPEGGRIGIRLQRHDVRARLTIVDGRNAGRAWATRPDDSPLDPLEMRSRIERQGGEFHIEPQTSNSGLRFVIDLPLRAIAIEGGSGVAVGALTGTATGAVTGAATAALAGPSAGASGGASGGVPAAAGGTEPTPPPDSAALAGLRVICIDDHEDARDMLRSVLGAVGAQVTAFASGSAALSWLEQHEPIEWPHLLVSDIALGNEDGRAVIRRIRQIEAERSLTLGQRLPAVALTALNQPGDRVRALLAGFQAHLGKPVEAAALIRKLQELAGQR